MVLVEKQKRHLDGLSEKARDAYTFRSIETGLDVRTHQTLNSLGGEWCRN